MISELGKSCTVYTTDKQVGIRIHKAIAMQQTFSNKQNPPSVGRKYRRGKILVRVCYNTGFNTFFILKSATPFPKCYLHKEKWTFDS